MRSRGPAPWLALLAALALLLWQGEEGGRRPMAQKSRPHPARTDTRRGGAANSGPRGRPAEDAQGLQPPPFAEVDAVDHLDGLRDDPLFSLFWHQQQRRIVERQYGHAIDSLNLPEGAAERLTDLLTARREAIADARDAAQQFGIVGPQANMAVKQSVDGLTDEIRQLVGADAYNAHIEPAPTVSACEELLDGAVGSPLASRGAALSAFQLHALAEDYVSAVYSPAASEGSQDPDAATGLTPQYQAFLDKAADTLTAVQASAFREFLMGQVRGLQAAAPPPAREND